jgi:hypothetical protein
MPFPGSLDTTTTLPNDRTTGDTSPASDRNDLATATIAIETKLGSGASTPTSGTVLRGNGTGTSTWGDADLTTDVTGVLPVANGETGGSSASAARTALGVAIGTDVEAHDACAGSLSILAGYWYDSGQGARTTLRRDRWGGEETIG